MKEKQVAVSRRKYDAAFKEEVLQMVFNGRPVSQVARSLGIGENIIYRWKSRHKARESKGEGSAPAAPDYQALHRRIRELETERDILKKSLGHFQPPGLKQVYSFIRANAASWPARTLCTVLQVSRSAYYGWLSAGGIVDKREEEAERLVLEVFGEHRRRYGVRRLVAGLKAQGVEMGANRVRLVLRKHGLRAIQPRSFVPRTTDSRHPYPISPNLLLELAFPASPNQVWWATSPTSRWWAGASFTWPCGWTSTPEG